MLVREQTASVNNRPAMQFSAHQKTISHNTPPHQPGRQAMTNRPIQCTDFPALAALGMIPNVYRSTLDHRLNDTAGLMVKRMTETIDEEQLQSRIDAMLKNFDVQSLLDPSMPNTGGMEILAVIERHLRSQVQRLLAQRNA